MLKDFAGYWPLLRNDWLRCKGQSGRPIGLVPILRPLFLDCRSAIQRGTVTLPQVRELFRIFSPTCDWDDVVGDVDLGNEIFSIIERLYRATFDNRGEVS